MNQEHNTAVSKVSPKHSALEKERGHLKEKNM